MCESITDLLPRQTGHALKGRGLAHLNLKVDTKLRMLGG